MGLAFTDLSMGSKIKSDLGNKFFFVAIMSIFLWKTNFQFLVNLKFKHIFSINSYFLKMFTKALGFESQMDV